MLIFVKLKGLFDLVGLFNKIANFGFKLFSNLIFFAHFMEVLKFFLFFFVIGFHLTDNRPNVVDVVSQSDTTECFDENQEKSLIVVGSADIAKSNGEHDVGAPVIAPNILVKPRFIFDSNFIIPRRFRIEASH